MWPVMLMAAGTVMSAYGNYKSNLAQADAEGKNAEYYREQAKMAAAAGAREESIFKRKSNIMFGNQVGAFAKGNVDLGSGSALDFLAESKVQTLNEISAIRTQTDARINLAMLRAGASEAHANSLRDPTNNFLQMGGTLLSGMGSIAKSASINEKQTPSLTDRSNGSDYGGTDRGYGSSGSSYSNYVNVS